MESITEKNVTNWKNERSKGNSVFVAQIHNPKLWHDKNGKVIDSTIDICGISEGTILHSGDIGEDNIKKWHQAVANAIYGGYTHELRDFEDFKETVDREKTIAHVYKLDVLAIGSKADAMFNKLDFYKENGIDYDFKNGRLAKESVENGKESRKTSGSEMGL